MCFYFWYFLIIRCALVPKTSEAKVLLARQNFVSAARFGYFLRRGLQRQGLRGTLGPQAISWHPTHLGTISSFIAADLFSQSSQSAFRTSELMIVYMAFPFANDSLKFVEYLFCIFCELLWDCKASWGLELERSLGQGHDSERSKPSSCIEI